MGIICMIHLHAMCRVWMSRPIGVSHNNAPPRTDAPIPKTRNGFRSVRVCVLSVSTRDTTEVSLRSTGTTIYRSAHMAYNPQPLLP